MFYGRAHELKIIKNAVGSNRAELGIVYGRRRVGKSTLLAKAIARAGDLYFEGLQRVPLKKQIGHFMQQLADQTQTPLGAARGWREAFDTLSFHIRKGKHYIVFDEFPWMASGRSELVSLLKYFWDNRWKANSGVTLVLCGSIAGFMISHLVHSKALHNRKTFEIQLPPLPASEAKLFFREFRSDFEIAKFLMIFGGVPKYLEQIDPRHSLANNIDRLCFQKHAFFLSEFETIFKEQFTVTRTYERMIRCLAERSCAKEELAQRLGMASGGGLSGYISNLERADFVKVFTPKSVLGKGDKTRKLVLWDEWLRFYFTYIAPNRQLIELNTEPGLFEQLAGPSLNTYFGLCFERLCLKNLPQIFSRMGMDTSSIMGFGPFFRQRKRNGEDDAGLQIDILVRRRSQVLTLIECKFSSQPTGVSVIEEVQRKVKLLGAPRAYTVERVLICAGEVTAPLQNSDYFHHILGLDAVFG
ncbi:MAG: ATP-binding protein [Desulfobacterales bacterium]